MAAAAQPLPIDIRLMQATANILWIVVGVGLVAVAFAWATKGQAFAVRSIRVEGEVTRNSVSTIRANAGPRLVGNLFTLDLAAGKLAFESVPWVRQAVLRRIWPDRLAVQLEEHRAAALWGEDRLVNTYGEVFEANLGDVEDDGLVQLRGPEGSARAMLQLYTQLVPLFETLDMRIDTLSQSGRGSWRVELDSGAEVELGRGSADEVLVRTRRFVRTVGQITQQYQRPLEYADLRHGEAYAVRLRGISTTPGAPTPKAARKKRPTH
jgi:cell division protein FtsQ